MRRAVRLSAVLGLLGLSLAAVGTEATSPRAGRDFVIGAPKGPRLSGADLDARTQDVGALLRCPVCQGLSVADSPATMAVNMKAQVREMLAAGYEQEQILASFEASYGEFVRLEPPIRGVNWLVWFGPFGALLAGGAMVTWTLRRSARRAAATEESEATDLPTRQTLPDDARLAAAVRRVREIAYGWPEGAPPRAEPPES